LERKTGEGKKTMTVTTLVQGKRIRTTGLIATRDGRGRKRGKKEDQPNF